MTTANKITVIRILMIPVFVTLAIYYGESIQEGKPQDWMRFTAVAVSLLAAVSDRRDGYVARRPLRLPFRTSAAAFDLTQLSALRPTEFMAPTWLA